MKANRALAIAAFVAGTALSTTAHADNACVIAGDSYELGDAAVNAIYDCIKDQMVEAYAKGGDEIATTYRSWAPTATRPAVAGAHSERFLMTFANDVAAEQYLKFEDEGVVMPVGSVLAKESFKANKKGIVKVGPLFLMTKLEAGGAPEYGDWLYGGIQPNGKPLKIKQSFCHDCHVGWEDQDALAYPLEEVRVSGE